MQKYKILLSYDGTHFNGWQVQPNGVTIQQTLQNALKILFQKQICVTGSGRTDAGVHALGQVAHFSLPTSIDPKKLLQALNGNLPSTIRIKEIDPVPITFHARYNTKRKTYYYHLHLRPVPSPFTALYSTHVRQPFDLPLLKRALPLFTNTHDFTSFANEAMRGSAKNNPIKTLYAIRCLEEPDGIRLEFEGNGFLYKMVRNLVGTLIEVAIKKRSVESIPILLAKKDRRAAPPPAPAKGLFLASVTYE